MRIELVLLFAIIGIAITLVYQPPAFAVIDGPCVDCHTMHNSQDGTSMNFDNTAAPNEVLLRADCLGCHGMGTSNKIVTIGGVDIPQVLHTEGSDLSTDLAGGNFAYITGAKSRVTADQNSAGHNVIVLGASFNETVLTVPPGGQHPGNPVLVNFRCAGRYGCHGKRYDDDKSSLEQVRGSHHANVDGKCDTATRPYNSYRFLVGVKGLENTTDKWQNKDENSHNEYFGDTTPMSGAGACTKCHDMVYGSVYPDNNTISGFCGTCHGNFHWLDDPFTAGGTGGIGGDISSPFTRHPTDVVLPGSGEYANYTAYSIEAPIARTTVPDAPSATVNPGTDVVMCLSCHAAHATPYADILKWDYTDMIAGDSSKSGGCFTCHTQKN